MDGMTKHQRQSGQLIVTLTDGRRVTVDAERFTVCDNGALSLVGGGVPVIAFAPRSWVSIHATAANIEMPPAPPPKGRSVPGAF